MKKKTKVIPIAKASIGLKCGDCIHFKRSPKFEKPCAQLGVKHFSNAPACYSPDPYILSSQSPDVLYRLGMLLHGFTAKETRVFLSIVKQSGDLEKTYKLKFGQPVFFRIGNDYLSNYFRGFVIGATNDGEGQVYITSDMERKQRRNPMIATMIRTSVFTVSEWKKKQAQLRGDKRLQDPKPLFATQKLPTKLDELYVPHTMESAPKEWFDKVEGRPKRKTRIKEQADGTLSFKMKSRA